MNESSGWSPVQWAMRQTVRDTELLGYYLPGGPTSSPSPA